MKRLVNNRPFVVFAIALSIGILCGYAAIKGYVWVMWLMVGVVATLTALLFVFKKVSFALLAMYSLICIFCGLFSFNLNVKRFSMDKYQEQSVSVSGKLTDFYGLYNDCIFIAVRDCFISQDDEVMQYKDRRIGMYVYFDEEINADLFLDNAGYFISFDCILSDVDIFADGINTYFMKNNIGFVASKVTNLSLTHGNSTFDEAARQYIRNTINTRMEGDVAAVSIALLLGDKSAMSLEIKNGYRAMGVSHIFAVSGLHIGFIYSVLAFLTFKLKIRRWKTLPITFIPMLFYAWICGFSPSVVRALIMTTCGMLAMVFGVKNDRLSTVAVAAILVLLIQPINLFDAGCLMSFGAVLGIVLLSSVINRKVRNKKPVLKAIYTTFFICFSATLGVVGIVADFYGEISLLGLIFNMIMTPVVGICFLLLLVGLIPFLNFVLFAPKMVFTVTNRVANFLVVNGFGTIPIKSFWLASILIVVGLFILGGFINLSKRSKIIAMSCISLAIAICGIVVRIPKKLDAAVECFESSVDACYVVTNGGRCAYIVCDFVRSADTFAIYDFCLDNDVEEAYIFVSSNYGFNVDNVLVLKDGGIEIIAVYSASEPFEYAAFTKMISADIDVFSFDANAKLDFENVEVTCLKDGSLCGWFFEVNDIGLLFSAPSTKTEIRRIYECAPAFPDVIFVNSEENFVSEFSGCTAVVTQNRGDGKKIFGTKNYGDFTLKLDSDKITIIP